MHSLVGTRILSPAPAPFRGCRSTAPKWPLRSCPWDLLISLCLSPLSREGEMARLVLRRRVEDGAGEGAEVHEQAAGGLQLHERRFDEPRGGGGDAPAPLPRPALVAAHLHRRWEKKLRIVALGTSGGRSAHAALRDAHRFPSTRWYLYRGLRVRRWGLGFVHHSRAIFCRAVPNLNVTIRNLFIAVRRTGHGGQRPRERWEGEHHS